jgi:hypothetical protein
MRAFRRPIFSKDKNGVVKAKLYVDNTTNEAKLEFYNDKGDVIGTFPK